MTMTDPMLSLEPSPERLRPALEGCATGSLPPNIAVMQLAMHAASAEEIGAALEAARAAVGQGPTAREARARLDQALRLWRENPQAFGIVKTMLDGVDHADEALGPEHWAETFDRLAAASPEGSVALYALGNPDLLRAATDEVVERLGDWGLLDADRRVLEIGCGIGRLLEALSPHVGQARGLDISSGMVERARERCAGLRNVSIEIASGRDLAGVKDGSVDLVLASDVFPYLVQEGPEAVERHLAEVARVLAPGGHFAILNFSYRGDHERDKAELGAAGARNGLTLRRVATGDFTLWDATTFLLQRP